MHDFARVIKINSNLGFCSAIEYDLKYILCVSVEPCISQ